MFEWKVEEMKLMNGNATKIGNIKLYDYESILRDEDKIAFVDSMQDGKLSYILSIIDKFEKEKDSLPKDKYGYVKTVSLKAWLKRNDTGYDRPIFDNWYHHGEYSLLGGKRNLNVLYYSKPPYDYYYDFIDECFHRQLIECERLEKKYFLEHDEYSILKKLLEDNIRKYHTTFGTNISSCSNGNVYIYSNEDTRREREITIDELKELNSKYEQLESFIQKITDETHIAY